MIAFGREICGDLPSALRREWLVTNGLGGFASGTLAGVNTRRYHGLLVAALTPPVGRTVLVANSVEWVQYQGRRYPLATHEYEGGFIHPNGFVHQQSFTLEGTLPVWIFALADALLERRIWMAHGTNTTYVRYRLLRGTAPAYLEITPLVTYRDMHNLTSGEGWQPDVSSEPEGAVIQAYEGAQPFRLQAEGDMFTAGGEWYWHFHHRAETERGLDDRADLFAPGVFTATLEPGEVMSLIYSTDLQSSPSADSALEAERRRQADLLIRAGAERDDPTVQQLVLAADQFIVRRAPASGDDHEGKTVIAGYPWFADWGRDTMITLPGLTLTTGRFEDAAEILRTFARFVQDGLLPNNFPDHLGTIPGYNTVDASLWYFIAMHAYQQATGDDALVDDILPVLQTMADAHIAGTRYHIGVDPADGLLHAGEPGIQLTWMDAKIGDWVVTPRTGKPVEINALWYNALRILERFLQIRGNPAAARYGDLAIKARASFRKRFIRADGQGLADVVDTPSGDDFSVRPNQIFAVSLPFPLLESLDQRAVVDAVGRSLLTSYGLRSLSPDDPAYRGDFTGDGFQRDSGYHQGPVWTWPIGGFAEAHYRAYGDREAALGFLRPFEHHLRDAGLGSISEVLEGDPPHLSKGCIAQAWGVSEVLRVWRLLQQQAAEA